MEVIWWTFFFIIRGGGTVCWIQRYQSVMKTSSHWRHKYNKEKQWTGPILVHFDPHIYINLHVKYGRNLIRTFRMKKMSCWAQGSRLHHSGDICTTRENNWKPVFHIWANMFKNVIFLAIWGALGGGGGHSMIKLGLSCFPAILSPISMYMWNKEAIW